ncbi:MAG TPA: AI-2E family transporter, partial [Chloroflexota bacterium]|nr:AI-2E family transporter [Chloroflexota bacterium]
MTRNMWRWLYSLLVLLTLLAGLYLLHWIFGALQTASTIVALFFFAWLLQFFMTPAVDMLNRRGLPRILAVSYVYVVVSLVMVIILAFSVPAAYGQAQHLADALASPKTYTVISSTTNAIENFLIQRFHVPPRQIQQFTQQYSVNLEHGAIKAGTQLQQLIKSHFTQTDISSSATTFLGFLNTLNFILLQFVIVL